MQCKKVIILCASAALFAQSCVSLDLRSKVVLGTFDNGDVYASLSAHKNRRWVTLEIYNKSNAAIRILPDESSVMSGKFHSLLVAEDTRGRNIGGSVPPITIPAGATVEKDFAADNAIHWTGKKGWKTRSWIPSESFSTYIFAYRKADTKVDITITTNEKIPLF